jgi:hypothetical protein
MRLRSVQYAMSGVLQPNSCSNSSPKCNPNNSNPNDSGPNDDL